MGDPPLSPCQGANWKRNSNVLFNIEYEKCKGWYIMQKQPLIILTGPTAVGKTKASIGLAKAIGGEIISADSMQV